MREQSSDSNPVGIRGIDHVVFYCGNADQAAYYYRTAFGFETQAYAGLETGVRDRISWVLGQGSARIVLSSGLDKSGAIAKHALKHGDSVAAIALRVDHAERAFEYAVGRGARPVSEPVRREDEHGTVVTATIGAFGDTLHTFVERDRYHGAFLPGFVSRQDPGRAQRAPLSSFDHFAIGVEPGTLNDWVEFYSTVFGFWECHEENVMGPHSGMRSKVVRGTTDDVIFPLLEPVPGPRTSQIQEYLNFNAGPGVQHAAMRTNDIIGAVRVLAREGIEFLRTPDTYYDALCARVGALSENVEDLRKLHVLVDRDDNGYLFQIFTKPVTGRPTFFLELIQRRGARGFGAGNIRALFEAMEREQQLRLEQTAGRV